jgi:spore germination protein KA
VDTPIDIVMFILTVSERLNLCASTFFLSLSAISKAWESEQSISKIENSSPPLRDTTSNTLIVSIKISAKTFNTISPLFIVTEGSNLVLSAPKVFTDFFNSSEDAFDSLYFGMFNKFIRIVALMIALTLSALYVAIVGFHSDILPVSYIMILASSRSAVPFNAVVEASLLEFVSEILREASVRLPKRIGSAIGIVGTIVIGQAAVSAGLVSPLMVIIVSLSTMCSFVASDFTIMNPIRILKFLLIFITGFLGLFGFILGITLILVNILSTLSFGVPYGAPISPLNLKDLKGYLLSDVFLSKKRPRFLRTKNKNK